jgi:hypothetical protein
MNRGNAGKGRRKGVPNKATADARAAIALFVDRNSPRLQRWLDQVANGVKAKFKTTRSDGTEEITERFVIEPNPAKAFELFQSVIEYHVPKLARTELTGAGGTPLAPPQVNIGFGNGGPGGSSAAE